MRFFLTALMFFLISCDRPPTVNRHIRANMSAIGTAVVENPRIHVDLGKKIYSNNEIFCNILMEMWDYNYLQLKPIIFDTCGNPYIILIKTDSNRIQTVTVLNQSKICKEMSSVELSVNVNSEDHVSFQFIIDGVPE